MSSQQELSSEISVASVLEESFSFVGKNFKNLFLIILLCFAPLIAGGTVIGFAFGSEPTSPAALFGSMGIAFFYLFAAIASQAAVAAGTGMSLDGKDFTVSASIRRAADRLFPLLGNSFLMFFAVLGASLFFFVPGIIVGCMLALVVPITVLESGQGALSRSRELTQGNRMTVFGVFMLGAVLSMLLQIPSLFIFGFQPQGMDFVASTMLNQVVQLPVTMAMAVALSVMYLKMRKAYDERIASAQASPSQAKA